MKRMLGRRGVAAASVVVVAIAVGGIAYASIPDANGVIHGCYKKTTGELIVIDSGGKGCEEGWKPLDWSQTGPTGATGSTGLSGLQTVTLASASNSVSPKEAAVLCPAGKSVTGGGATILGGSVASGPTDLAETVALKASRPVIVGGSDAWTARAEEIAPGFDGNWSLTIYAICANVAA